MKRFFILSFVLIAALAVSAQNATESIIDLGGQQLPGYLIDIPNADAKSVDAAFRDKLEKNYNLKATKESGFRAYLNQPFSPFGTANYDIYFIVKEYGKKKNRITQLSVIVSTGNKNAISSQNDSKTADYIKVFLRDFVTDFSKNYSIQQQADNLEVELAKLNKEKSDLEKDQGKLNKQIEKFNKKLSQNKDQITEKANKIEEIKADLQQVKQQLK